MMTFWRLGAVLLVFIASVSLGFADSGENPSAGYRMQEIAPGSIFEKIGLKNGDTILEWNGRPIQIGELGKAWAESRRGSGRVRLKILRDGKVKTLTYSLK